MVVVRLSRIALRKKVTKPISHIRRDLARGADARGDDLEAVVGVDHLDDGHRADQEEHDLRGGSDGFVELRVPTIAWSPHRTA